MGSLAERQAASGLPGRPRPALAHQRASQWTAAPGSGPQQRPAPSCRGSSWPPPPPQGSGRNRIPVLRPQPCREGGIFSFPSGKPTGARPAMPSSAACEPSHLPSCSKSPGEERSPQKGRLAQLKAHLAQALGPSLDMRPRPPSPSCLPLLPASPRPRGSSCSLLLGALARILPPLLTEA